MSHVRRRRASSAPTRRARDSTRERVLGPRPTPEDGLFRVPRVLGG